MTDYLLTVDPGKASGVALIDMTDMNDVTLVWSRELDQWDTCSIADGLCRASISADDTLEVVCESFHITSETAKKTPAAWSLEIIGSLRYFTTRDGVRFTLQTPTAAKQFVDNDRLRRLKMWHKGGAGHANDSLRHAVLYLVEKKDWRPDNLLA